MCPRLHRTGVPNSSWKPAARGPLPSLYAVEELKEALLPQARKAGISLPAASVRNTNLCFSYSVYEGKYYRECLQVVS